MATLCQSCSCIDFQALFFGHFSNFARFLPLVADVEDDDLMYGEDKCFTVSRDREGYLGDDTTFDSDGERQLMQDFLDSIGFTADRTSPVLRAFFEENLYAPLSYNQFVKPLGSASDIRRRAQSCNLCAWFIDHRLWRLPASCESNNAREGINYDPALVGSDWQCYLLPIWPRWKAMWQKIHDSPNELYILPVPNGSELPLQATDDSFHSYTRDFRTIGMVDDERAIWEVVPRLVDWSMIRSWFHALGPIKREVLDLGPTASLSFMLIDIRQEAIVTVASLKGLCYAALSYVWGRAKSSEEWCQKIQRVHDQKLNTPVHIDVANLPLTLQGAIEICRNLKLPYLWVDSLCIAQNASHEKAQTIADMGHIYLGSHVCIAAAAEADVHQALPGINRARLSQHIKVNGMTTVITPPRLSDSVRRSTWNTRGWTFQEAMLAPTSLVILPDQIFLQSGRSIRCESIAFEVGNDYESPSEEYWPEPLTTLGLYEADMVSNESFSIYRDMVEDYSRRQLLFQSDIRNAFQGLALALSRRFNIDMEYALPVTSFGQSLNWARSKLRVIKRRRDEQGRLVFPSYSWLSVVGPVAYTTLPKDGSLKTMPCFDEMPTIRKNPFCTFRATGFETNFAIKPHPTNGYSILDGALPITSTLRALDLETQAGIHSTRQELIDAVSRSTNITFDNPEALPQSQLYMVPIAFTPRWESTPDVLTMALVVEIYPYPHVSITTWPYPCISSAVPENTQVRSVKHKLTRQELLEQVFLIKRVGILQYGFLPREFKLPRDFPTDQIVRLILA